MAAQSASAAASDSWLSVGSNGGNTRGDIASIGIKFDKWTESKALVVDDGNVVFFDLAVTFITAELPRRLDDTEDAATGACLSMAKQPSVGIDRKAAFNRRLALEVPLAAFAPLGETKFFHFDDWNDGEAIV